MKRKTTWKFDGGWSVEGKKLEGKREFRRKDESNVIMGNRNTPLTSELSHGVGEVPRNRMYVGEGLNVNRGEHSLKD